VVATKSGIPFMLYVAAEKDVIGGVLTQETEGKEYIVAYESRRLLDAETRYTFIENLCLSNISYLYQVEALSIT
jgi:hypothetical protein